MSLPFNPPEKVTRWLPIVDKYCVELGVSQALMLALIHQESGGDPNARRHEPGYEQKYILGNSAWLGRCRESGISTKDMATSWGLCQVMMATAWGYNMRSPSDLLKANNNIRVGTAIMAYNVKKYGVEGGLVAYNGGAGALKGGKSPAWGYAKNVLALKEAYAKWTSARKG
jgi:soluble lytic murein transglycosylase-like protein